MSSSKDFYKDKHILYFGSDSTLVKLFNDVKIEPKTLYHNIVTDISSQLNRDNIKQKTPIEVFTNNVPINLIIIENTDSSMDISAYVSLSLFPMSLVMMKNIMDADFSAPKSASEVLRGLQEVPIEFTETLKDIKEIPTIVKAVSSVSSITNLENKSSVVILDDALKRLSTIGSPDQLTTDLKEDLEIVKEYVLLYDKVLFKFVDLYDKIIEFVNAPAAEQPSINLQDSKELKEIYDNIIAKNTLANQQVDSFMNKVLSITKKKSTDKAFNEAIIDFIHQFNSYDSSISSIMDPDVFKNVLDSFNTTEYLNDPDVIAIKDVFDRYIRIWRIKNDYGLYEKRLFSDTARGLKRKLPFLFGDQSSLFIDYFDDRKDDDGNDDKKPQSGGKSLKKGGALPTVTTAGKKHMGFTEGTFANIATTLLKNDENIVFVNEILDDMRKKLNEKLTPMYPEPEWYEQFHDKFGNHPRPAIYFLYNLTTLVLLPLTVVAGTTGKTASYLVSNSSKKDGVIKTEAIQLGGADPIVPSQVSLALKEAIKNEILKENLGLDIQKIKEHFTNKLNSLLGDDGQLLKTDSSDSFEKSVINDLNGKSITNDKVTSEQDYINFINTLIDQVHEEINNTTNQSNQSDQSNLPPSNESKDKVSIELVPEFVMKLMKESVGAKDPTLVVPFEEFIRKRFVNMLSAKPSESTQKSEEAHQKPLTEPIEQSQQEPTALIKPAQQPEENQQSNEQIIPKLEKLSENSAKTEEISSPLSIIADIEKIINDVDIKLKSLDEIVKTENNEKESGAQEPGSERSWKKTVEENSNKIDDQIGTALHLLGEAKNKLSETNPYDINKLEQLKELEDKLLEQKNRSLELALGTTLPKQQGGASEDNQELLIALSDIFLKICFNIDNFLSLNKDEKQLKKSQVFKSMMGYFLVPEYYISPELLQLQNNASEEKWKYIDTFKRRVEVHLKDSEQNLLRTILETLCYILLDVLKKASEKKVDFITQHLNKLYGITTIFKESKNSKFLEQFMDSTQLTNFKDQCNKIHHGLTEILKSPLFNMKNVNIVGKFPTEIQFSQEDNETVTNILRSDPFLFNVLYPEAVNFGKDNLTKTINEFNFLSANENQNPLMAISPTIARISELFAVYRNREKNILTEFIKKNTILNNFMNYIKILRTATMFGTDVTARSLQLQNAIGSQQGGASPTEDAAAEKEVTDKLVDIIGRKFINPDTITRAVQSYVSAFRNKKPIRAIKVQNVKDALLNRTMANPELQKVMPLEYDEILPITKSKKFTTYENIMKTIKSPQPASKNASTNANQFENASAVKQQEQVRMIDQREAEAQRTQDKTAKMLAQMEEQKKLLLGNYPTPTSSAAQMVTQSVISSPVVSQQLLQPNTVTVPPTGSITVTNTQQTTALTSKAVNLFSSKKQSQKRYESVLKSITDYSMFVDEMVQKEANWLQTINNNSYVSEVKHVKDMLAKEQDPKSSHKKRAYRRATEVIKKASTMLMSRAEKCYEDIKNFHIKSHRRDLKGIIDYLRDEYMRVEHIQDPKLKQETLKNPDMIRKILDDYMTKLKTSTDKFFAAIMTKLDEVEVFMHTNVGSMEYSDENYEKTIAEEIKNKREKINMVRNKILSIYKLNYSIMDILFDSQFMILYVIKGLRILFMYVALFLATRIFIPMYEVAVYDNKTNPPPLWRYLLIFLGFDLAFNAFLVVALFLLMYIFSSPDNTFPINRYLFMKYLTDYVMSMSLTLIISYVISGVIVNKKYFKYKYEGARAIRAFENLVFKVGIIITLLPFFWVI